ncbi:glycosyltransferase, partial [Aliarcobacter skirrowii]|uniref:glycosyltransferase n=1 Tax=Aliarcobacter skirrowii TaxID=28200 RepID=UPI0029A98EB6
MIKVSVIIPVYNAQNYLNRCLDSVLNQTLKELEIIAVNDGSTDDSLNMLNRYKIQDNRIKIIDQKNCGTGIARNNGIKIAKGEYIAFVDADDTIEETMIEKLYKKILQEQSDIVVCNINRVDPKLGKKISTRAYSDMDKATFFNYILSFKYGSFVWAKLYKKSLFLNNNILFPSKLKHNEDNATFFKFVYYAKKISFLKEYLYNWMIVENSKSENISKERLDSINSVLTIRYNFLKKHNIYNIYDNDFLVGMLKLLELRIQNVLILNTKELVNYITEIIIKLDFFTKINLLKAKK